MIFNIIIVSIAILFIFLIMFNPKVKMFIRNNNDLVLSILYLYITVWFIRVIFKSSGIRQTIKLMTRKPEYFIKGLIFIGIPLFFLYKTITTFIDFYKKYKSNKNKAK